MIFLALALLIAPPDTLRLEACYRDAEAHYPRRQELALQEAITDLKVQNLSARYLPSLSLRGQALYYSDVPSITLPSAGGATPRPSKDQYKASLGVEQLLYDGGQIAGQKALERVQRDLAKQEVALELYQLREQVNAAYFGVLLQQAQLATLAALAADLQAKQQQMQARVREGVVLASNADVLAVELLRVAQQQAKAEAARRSALAVLGELIGRPLPEETVLALPRTAMQADTTASERPEYALFDLRKTQLARQQVLATRKNRPTVSGFAEAAYGRPPGIDFFDNDFTPFYSFGLRVQWPFWDWHASRRERDVLGLQQDVVAAQEEAFTQNLGIALRQQRSDVERLEALLARDDEIIALRARITAQAASQLDHGVITATDYLTERTAEHQARLTQQLHLIQLAQAHVQYQTTFGTP